MAHIRKQQIAFFVTTECNLRCRYCYTPRIEVRPEHRHINVDFAKRGLHDFFRDYPSRQIRFYGAGEPTLEIASDGSSPPFERMREIHSHALGMVGDKLVVELQTNGYFSSIVRDWITQHVDILWISCDGPPDIQDYWRPKDKMESSSDIVEKTIFFFARQNHMQVGVRVTCHRNTVDRLSEIVSYLHRLGVKYVCIDPVFAGINRKLPEAQTISPEEFVDSFVHAFYRAQDIGMFCSSLLTVNFDEETRHYCRACVPYPHLTTDGYVSCCDFAILGNEYSLGPLEQLIYGKYDLASGRINYDEEKTFAIRKRCVETLGQGPCKGCTILYHCAGGCVGRAVNETGSLETIKQWDCIVTRLLAQRLPINQGLFPVLHS